MSNQNFEEILRQEVRRLAKKKIAEGMLEESLVNWMLDKVSNFAKGHFNHVKDYQYARLMSDPKFKELHKKFNMGEKEFMAKASALVKKDPKKFMDMLAYDASKSRYAKFF
jgi:hypothetical protein